MQIAALIAMALPLVSYAVQLQQLSIKTAATPGVQVGASSLEHSWHLSPTNKTTKIDAAYKYGNNIALFGWVGCCSGVTTIIDAVANKERLEFLNYFLKISPGGAVVFEQFYPHFTDPQLVSDSIRILDLNSVVPQKVPAPSQNPTDDLGLTVYPDASAKSSKRHLIGGSFLLDTRGEAILLVDHRVPSEQFCFVRISLIPRRQQKQEECVSVQELGVVSSA